MTRNSVCGNPFPAAEWPFFGEQAGPFTGPRRGNPIIMPMETHLPLELPEGFPAASASLSGLGVHTGSAGRITFGLSEPGGPKSISDPLVSYPGFPDPLSPADWRSLKRTALRSTILGEGDRMVRTPEHLLAALLFFRDLPLRIVCDAAETPCLDGSALPFREALTGIAPGHAAEPRWREYPCDLEWDHAWDHGHIRVRPAAHFRVRYSWERQPMRQEFTLEDAATAWREILPARTFAYHRDWVRATAEGLMAGAREDSGLLLAGSEAEHGELLGLNPEWRGGPFPLLNQAAWRMPDEPVKHKILDLLGDLALVDLALPRLDMEIRNGGHDVNHLLIDRILAARA
ncbi:MAG: lpxC [Fibrobacteres bacterium]|nr:lpxC [Fibrobacterota bacterium]